MVAAYAATVSGNAVSGAPAPRSAEVLQGLSDFVKTTLEHKAMGALKDMSQQEDLTSAHNGAGAMPAAVAPGVAALTPEQQLMLQQLSSQLEAGKQQHQQQ
jgi:hypothetical protein